ncbi:MAG: FAD-dependent monooxygenase [Alphaproteobacteria bacterium]
MKTDVLIVGAGPVGMLAGLFLSTQGVSSLIVERRFERLSAPKAHAVNPRTLEMCHQAGLSGDFIRSHGAPVSLSGDVRFVTGLGGTEFGSLPYERQTEAARTITPFPLVNMSQPKFEGLIAAELHNRDNVGLLRGAECTSVRQHDAGVTAEITLRGVAQPLEVEAAYVIAADGAGSPTRAALGIDMEGPDALENFIMIHCEGDLSAVTGDKPGVLYFAMDPAAPGSFIFFDDSKTWVFMRPYNPAEEPATAFDEPRCRAEIAKAMGHADVPFKVRTISPWAMSAQIATRYRQGRVFLAGDAAHRFPPTGGLGLNTGAGDAQNLAWKLAYVLQGKAGDDLLNTYEAERRPVAQHNSAQSLMNAAKMFDLLAALYGPDPATQAEHFAALAKTPSQPKVRQGVEAQRPHFDSIRLQLGYRYGSSALVGSPDAPTDSEMDISKYEPSYEVGALLPHEWLADNTPILEKLAANRFTLLQGCDASAPLCDGHQLASFTYPTCWREKTGLPNEGALLIRPDGHIAARYENLRAASHLTHDLNTILARKA